MIITFESSESDFYLALKFLNYKLFAEDDQSYALNLN